MSAESSYERCKEQRPQLIEISGTKPGLLDDTQPSRLLRTSNSTLSFASFDPYIAAPHELGFQQLNLKAESCRPKRIVIETIPGHGSFWRWVPSARTMQDVKDEGVFPRVVDICGRYVYCSQDQWDMYKLDPKYDCFVKYPPALTVISIKDEKHIGTSSNSSRFGDVDGVEPMIVDDDPTPFNPHTPQMSSHAIPNQMPQHIFGFTSPLPNNAEELKPRKRVNISFQGLSPSEDNQNEFLEQDSSNRNTRYYTPKNQKRARTLSPESKRRALNATRSSRRNAKQGKWENEIKARREQWENHFWKEVLSEVPPAEINTQKNRFDDIPEEDETSHSPGPQPPDTENQPAEEDDHDSRLAESRRKMEQLNADRARQRVRESRERGEEFISTRSKSEGPDYSQRQKAKLEEEKRKEEAKRHEQEQIRSRKEEEARHLRNHLLESFQRERIARHQPWSQGPWNSSRAIERYKAISLFFDKAKFSSTHSPLTHIDIPWPTLQHPSLSSPRDMDWETVTQFFNTVKVGLRGQAFNDLIKLSLQRFHPDRWKSRNLYSAIVQENDRNEIETAVSTVSKALGSLWADLKASSDV